MEVQTSGPHRADMLYPLTVIRPSSLMRRANVRLRHPLTTVLRAGADRILLRMPPLDLFLGHLDDGLRLRPGAGEPDRLAALRGTRAFGGVASTRALSDRGRPQTRARPASERNQSPAFRIGLCP
jgi:hypothetical protein